MRQVCIIVLLSAFIAGCVGVHHGGQSLVGRVVTREERAPIPDVSVSLEYNLNMFTGSVKRLGPYYTDASGRFTVPAHEFTIVTTGTIFDGSTKATFYFTGPDGRKWVDWNPERNPNGELVFLALPRKEPNQALLPTPTSVTPLPAAQEPRQP